jgi:integrase
MPALKITNQLKALWPQYTAFKATFLHPNTITKQYGKWQSIILKLPSYVETATDVVDWMLQKYASETARRFVEAMHACLEWAIRMGKAKTNPFHQHSKTIKKTAYNRREAFTATERDVILEAFRFRDPSYWGFVAFAFRTGARPEESRGLEWGHIHGDYLRFQQAIATGTKQPAPLKTGIDRVFPISQKLQAILTNQKGLHPRWVFPTQEGRPIDGMNFQHRHWKPMVIPLVNSEQIDRYLSFGHARHTWITLALKAGVEVADVAKLAGNSSETIWKHYAQASKSIILPDF